MQNILIVEDDNHLCNTLAFYLNTIGFQVYTSNEVEKAIKILIIYEINLIVSDIMMYKLNGYDFIKIVKLDNRLWDIPFIFLTAKGMTLDRIKGYNLGCHAYITKPFNPDELLSLIQNIVNNFYLSSNFVHTINDQLIANPINLFALQYLTQKEKKILSLVIHGYTNKEISIKLKINLRSVEKYVSKLLYKSNSRNRTNLVRMIFSSENIV